MSDVTITLTIPFNKVDEFKAGFLNDAPESDKDPVTEEFTDEYLSEYVKAWVFKKYQQGKEEIAAIETTPAVDEDVIDVDLEEV